jgi:hypothetical protein
MRFKLGYASVSFIPLPRPFNHLKAKLPQLSVASCLTVGWTL